MKSFEFNEVEVVSVKSSSVKVDRCQSRLETRSKFVRELEVLPEKTELGTLNCLRQFDKAALPSLQAKKCNPPRWSDDS